MNETNKPLALPLFYKENITYTLAMHVRELVTLTMDGTAAPEDLLPEMDYILQALQQVHFSPTSPEPLPKEEKREEVDGPEALTRLASILKDGWIAQNASENWYYYINKPDAIVEIGRWNDTECGRWYSLSPFNLPQFSDWTDSLYQIKNGKLEKCQKKKSK